MSSYVSSEIMKLFRVKQEGKNFGSVWLCFEIEVKKLVGHMICMIIFYLHLFETFTFKSSSFSAIKNVQKIDIRVLISSQLFN